MTVQQDIASLSGSKAIDTSKLFKAPTGTARGSGDTSVQDRSERQVSLG
jgi:hypothetical protein